VRILKFCKELYRLREQVGHLETLRVQLEVGFLIVAAEFQFGLSVGRRVGSIVTPIILRSMSLSVAPLTRFDRALDVVDGDVCQAE
jgi:hypothetical protein